MEVRCSVCGDNITGTLRWAHDNGTCPGGVIGLGVGVMSPNRTQVVDTFTEVALVVMSFVGFFAGLGVGWTVWGAG